MTEEQGASTLVGASEDARPVAGDQATRSVRSVDVGGVAMTARREVRIRHASDVVGDDGVAFGGDTMGHWNVCRINRILDAIGAHCVRLPIPRENMIGMARVGAPDMTRVGQYLQRGFSTMPPLSFVTLPDPNRPDVVRTMLVDGHHRMMALAMGGATSVPARVLPPELSNDVRIVEMSEVAVFPEPCFAMNEVELGRSRGMR